MLPAIAAYFKPTTTPSTVETSAKQEGKETKIQPSQTKLFYDMWPPALQLPLTPFAPGVTLQLF